MTAGSACTMRASSRQCTSAGVCARASRSNGSHRLAGSLPRAVAAPERPREAEAPVQTFQDPSYDRPAAPPAQAAASTSGRVVLESDDELRSTWEHRAWVGATTALLGATLANGLAHVEGVGGAASAAAALGAAYVLSDLGTAVYHWGVDNYGSASTPLVGGQIAAFQGHHQRPWTITEREFANNVHKVFKPAALPAAALLAASFAAPPSWDVFSSSFLFLACMSQQFHAWSHMKRSELHPAVVAAQEAGVLISRKAHGAHHKAPFEGNYAIVSGMWNPVLDRDGADDAFFRQLERWIHARWGVEPRCWHEPGVGWEELER